MPHPDTNKPPLVSFVVASYNYAAFIGRTLASLLAQTIPDFEIIVIDDQSSDASRDIVRSFTDPRIRLHVNERNRGVAYTFNRGVALARAEFVNFVASDDWIEPDKLEMQLGLMRRDPRVDVVGSYLAFVDLDGRRHPLADHYEAAFNRPHDFNRLETWVGENKLSSPTVLFRRDVYDRIGPRDETMRVGSDFELWTRAHLRGCRFAMVEHILATHRVHGASVGQRDRMAQLLEQIYAVHRNLMPAITAAGAYHLVPAVIDWLVTHPCFGRFDESVRHHVLGSLLRAPPPTNCTAYTDALAHQSDPAMTELGARIHAAYVLHPERADREARIARLSELLQIAETDRAARLEQIHRLTDLLRESESDRAARLQQVHQLTDQVKALQVDGAARLDQIHRLTDLAKAAQAECVAGHEQIRRLTEQMRRPLSALLWDRWRGKDRSELS